MIWVAEKYIFYIENVLDWIIKPSKLPKLYYLFAVGSKALDSMNIKWESEVRSPLNNEKNRQNVGLCFILFGLFVFMIYGNKLEYDDLNSLQRLLT